MIQRLLGGTTAVLLGLASCNDGGGGSAETGTASESTETGSASVSASTTAPTQTGVDGSSTVTTDPDGSASSTGVGSSESSTTGSEPTGGLDCPYTPVDGDPPLVLERLAGGFDRPVFAIGHPTQPDRLFVVEQGGAVRILEPGATEAPADAFLELSVGCGTQAFIGCEYGMFSLAFHPEFADNGRVYVAYSVGGTALPPTRVAEFTVDENDPNHVDPDSFRVVIDAAQPFGNHNGGQIAFGPDGLLYIGLGDGGDGFDTAMTSRDPGVILSKLLRIDPEPDGSPDSPVACYELCDDPGPFDYTIPADNPFVDDPAFTPEVYAWGLRNPWRFSFDPVDGTLWLGDVGQDEWEEIDIIVPGGDYGWADLEGNHCENDLGCDATAAPNQPNAANQIAPVFEYHHGEGPTQGCSVTGGIVYRSCEVPAWDGIYMYGDYCTPQIRGLRYDGTNVEDLGVLVDSGERVLGYGTNAYGDVFFTTVDAVVNGPITDGYVYRVAPQR